MQCSDGCLDVFDWYAVVRGVDKESFWNSTCQDAVVGIVVNCRLGCDSMFIQ